MFPITTNIAKVWMINRNPVRACPSIGEVQVPSSRDSVHAVTSVERSMPGRASRRSTMPRPSPRRVRAGIAGAVLAAGAAVSTRCSASLTPAGATRPTRRTSPSYRTTASGITIFITCTAACGTPGAITGAPRSANVLSRCCIGSNGDDVQPLTAAVGIRLTP